MSKFTEIESFPDNESAERALYDKPKRYFPRLATDAELGRKDRRLAMTNDCDICRECKEHAGFEETDEGEMLSECCGAPAYQPDEYERWED